MLTQAIESSIEFAAPNGTPLVSLGTSRYMDYEIDRFQSFALSSRPARGCLTQLDLTLSAYQWAKENAWSEPAELPEIYLDETGYPEANSYRQLLCSDIGIVDEELAKLGGELDEALLSPEGQASAYRIRWFQYRLQELEVEEVRGKPSNSESSTEESSALPQDPAAQMLEEASSLGSSLGDDTVSG